MTIVRAPDTETSVRAAALLAGLGAGLWPSLDALPRLLDRRARVFEPQMGDAERAELLGRWGRAVERARGWV